MRLIVNIDNIENIETIEKCYIYNIMTAIYFFKYQYICIKSINILLNISII